MAAMLSELAFSLLLGQGILELLLAVARRFLGKAFQVHKHGQLA